ncbi:MAG: hypothetical protein IT585_03145, partial [candidate division Zixibacteria bacterium]|nr:hypothetical protein [candidate division Zixibacteria bacterium]
MTKRILLVLALMLALAVFVAPSAQAQPQISAADTFRVVDTKGAPGAIVPLDLFVVNSKTLLAYNTFIRIDTSIVRFVGVEDAGNYFVNIENIDRGNNNIFCFTPPSMVANDSVNGAIFAAGDLNPANGCTFMPIGRGRIARFYVQVKPNISLGTTTDI